MDSPLIAIVDDDESVRLALAGLVRSLGYRALAFASAEDFLASGETGEIGCVVTDIHMPGLSGFDLKARLAATPVIMITGRSDPMLQDRASASGATCFLKKPFAPEALVSCLEKALAA